MFGFPGYNKRKWILIPIEVKAREYHSRLLLALEAVKRGYGVIIGQESQIRYRIKSLPKGIYFAKQLSKRAYEWHINHTLTNGYIIVSNDEEGLASVGNQYFYINERHSQDMLNHVYRFFAWGEFERKIILNNFENINDKVVAIGNPRVDLWKSQLRGIYKNQADEYQKKYGNYILMPSSFSMIRHALGAEYIYNQYEKKGLLDTEEGKKDFAQLLLLMQKSVDKFEKLAIKISNTFDKTIIVRPHPSESIEAWGNVFCNYPNIKVVKEGEIAPWILGSDLVIHSFCTTGLEAFLMQKPVISYKSDTSHPYSEFISNRIGFMAITDEEVFKLIAQIENGELSFQDSWRQGQIVLRNFINSLDENEFAYIKIIDELSKIKQWEEKSFERLRKFNNRMLKQNLKHQINFFFKKNIFEAANTHSINEQLFPCINRKEMVKDIEEILRYSNLRMPKVLNKIDENVFIMHD